MYSDIGISNWQEIVSLEDPGEILFRRPLSDQVHSRFCSGSGSSLSSRSCPSVHLQRYSPYCSGRIKCTQESDPSRLHSSCDKEIKELSPLRPLQILTDDLTHSLEYIHLTGVKAMLDACRNLHQFSGNLPTYPAASLALPCHHTTEGHNLLHHSSNPEQILSLANHPSKYSPILANHTSPHSHSLDLPRSHTATGNSHSPNLLEPTRSGDALALLATIAGHPCGHSPVLAHQRHGLSPSQPSSHSCGQSPVLASPGSGHSPVQPMPCSHPTTPNNHSPLSALPGGSSPVCSGSLQLAPCQGSPMYAHAQQPSCRYPTTQPSGHERDMVRFA